MRTWKKAVVAVMIVGGVVSSALAAATDSSKQPIEITSDTLDVVQAEQKAIFSGNVLAIQGSTQMRANKMVVFYRDANDKAAAAGQQGISRIEATGSVLFTTPGETAQGDMAIYNVDSETIDLTGTSVVLTRGQNVLKGNKLIHNMATSRSVLSGGVTATGEGAKTGRVRGLFVPNAEDKKVGQ